MSTTPTCPCGSTATLGGSAVTPIVEVSWHWLLGHRERRIGTMAPCAECGRPLTILRGRIVKTPRVLALWHPSAHETPPQGQAKREARSGDEDTEHGLTHSGSDMRFPAGRV